MVTATTKAKVEATAAAMHMIMAMFMANLHSPCPRFPYGPFMANLGGLLHKGGLLLVFPEDRM